MLSRDKSSQPIIMSPDETQVILKALSYYQIRLFDEITKQKTQSLTEEIAQTTALIKKIHYFQEDEYYRPEEWVLVEVRPHLESQNSHTVLRILQCFDIKIISPKDQKFDLKSAMFL